MANSGGEVGFVDVPWFDGGLFDDATALPLERDDIDLLIVWRSWIGRRSIPRSSARCSSAVSIPTSAANWARTIPNREKIELLIDPVIRRPLQAEWAAVQDEDRGGSGAAGHARAAAPATVMPRRRCFIMSSCERLRQFRVLDPACGSGNFLYLSLQALKDLEHQASVEAEALGLQREFPQVGPETMLGIEINPYAAELARVSVWIGHIQWTRRHGYAAPSDPVLQPLDTIECRDAILTPDGERPNWPQANVIVGNPPILGTKKQLSVLGADYIGRLRKAFVSSIPASSDLCCYWFEQARQCVDTGRAARVGLVATANIRGGYSRPVLDRIKELQTIVEAWSNEPWTLDGADLRVSLICFGKATGNEFRLNGDPVVRINADLTSSEADLTSALTLSENRGIAFSGTVKGGKFDLDGELARKWLVEPNNVNGRPNSDVLMRWMNASDVTVRDRGMWIIDFGQVRTENDASIYAFPYSFVYGNVRDAKQKSSKYGSKWWLLSEYCPGMRGAIAPLSRYIATPTGTSHRVFVWLDLRIQSDHQLVVIALDNDVMFGILHSRFHELWTLGIQGRR